jgi:hypothetical protein
MYIKNFVFILLILTSVSSLKAQFGIGFTVTNDLYMRAANPDDDIASEGAGSVLMNFGVGPKIWLGGEKASLSLEATAMIAPFAISIVDYKGIGMAAFPLMAKLNFGGMSGLDKEGKFGFYIGAGVQYTRTELFYVTNGFKDDGGTRALFDTYIGQVGYGFGMSGFAASLYTRVGYNKDTKANLFSLGFQFDFNIPKLKEINSPSSSL